MKKLVRWTVALGTLAGLGVLFYKFALSDEAKEGVCSAARSVRDACEDISERVSDLYGTEGEEDVAQHQRDVALQWEHLGY